MLSVAFAQTAAPGSDIDAQQRALSEQQQIEKQIHKSPNWARYAMNNAIIALGVWRPKVRKDAVAAATRIGKVDVNHGDVDNVTPLVTAIMNKQYTLSKFLIDRGADVNIIDAGGRTALYAMIDIRNEDWTAMPNRTTDDPLPTLNVVAAIIDHGAHFAVVHAANKGVAAVQSSFLNQNRGHRTPAAVELGFDNCAAR